MYITLQDRRNLISAGLNFEETAELIWSASASSCLLQTARSLTHCFVCVVAVRLHRSQSIIAMSSPGASKGDALPTFRATLQEMQDFEKVRSNLDMCLHGDNLLQLASKLESLYAQYGACKVVPPPEFVANKAAYKVRNQAELPSPSLTISVLQNALGNIIILNTIRQVRSSTEFRCITDYSCSGSERRRFQGELSTRERSGKS